MKMIEIKHSTIKKKIVFFYFGLTRKHTKEDIESLSKILDELLNILKTSLCECDDTLEIRVYISYFILLYKLIVYTRDIFSGKGERDLTYMMIEIWYKYFPILAKYMLEIIPENYGSWKDLKYFCKYTNHDICIDYCIELWNNQLEKDVKEDENGKISMVSKWIPREKSAFGWLFEKSAIEWNSRTYSNLPINQNQIKKEYRKIISSLNRKIDTPQIKETQRKWSKIIPENISITTKSKQYNTFMNKTQNIKPDRIQCQSNFENYFSIISSLQTSTDYRSSMRIKSFQLGEYIKNPHIQNQKYWNEIKKDILQTKTRNNLNHFLLPIINISITNNDEYIDAIGIGCMISEISRIKNRVIVYDQNASWINLTGCDLENKIKKIKARTVLKGNSNIWSAIELIKEAKPDKNIIMVIISDFSIEKIDELEKSEIGNIIFWNIGSKIPIFQIPRKNIVISGTSSSTINNILEIIDKDNYDPYFFINELTNQIRYIPVEEFFQNTIMNKNIY
jgi:hypothetical protein